MSGYLTIPMKDVDSLAITKLILRTCDKGDHFECRHPKCSFSTKDGNEMVAHIQTHINEFLAGTWT